MQPIRVPRDPLEFRERVQYADNLRKQANQLIASGASQGKVDDVFQKLAQVQEGFCYPAADAKSLKKNIFEADLATKWGLKDFLHNHIAFLDHSTGTLTVSQKESNQYQVGQELPAKVGNKARTGFYHWDKKTKTAKELPVAMVFHDSERNVTTSFQDLLASYFLAPRGVVLNINLEDASQKIKQIEVLSKDRMKQFVKTFSKPRVPLFDVADEKNNAQIQGQAIQPQMQIDKKPEVNPLLKKWLEEPLDPTVIEIPNLDVNNPKEDIYFFGADNEDPVYGVYTNRQHGERNFSQYLTGGAYYGAYGEAYGAYTFHPFHAKYDEKLGVEKSLKLTEKNLTALGRVDDNSFLSNSYQKELHIPGESRSSYPSVLHYLICKIIAKIQSPKIKGLEEKLLRAKDATEANYWYEFEAYTSGVLPETYRMFRGMDRELKTALFYKFVGTDGRPNEEGMRLLATGDKMLYAGNERGDPSYGMRIISEKNGVRPMQGANKLGKALMELRSMLREQEQKNGNLNMFYVPQNSSAKPLPQPKMKNPYMLSNIRGGLVSI